MELTLCGKDTAVFDRLMAGHLDHMTGAEIRQQFAGEAATADAFDPWAEDRQRAAKAREDATAAAVAAFEEEGHDGAHVVISDPGLADLMRGCFPLCTCCYSEEERAAWGWQPGDPPF